MKKYLTLLLLSFSSINFATNQPKLIVQLVVDQLRGDLIVQHQKNFGQDGFNYLLAHGLDYHNTHHRHAHTVTCAGHATIATGSDPALHGIVSNDWYDKNSGKEIYCVEDLASTILPTLRTKKQPAGRSPQNLMVSTLSDELVMAKTGKAFGVSLKDRSAITLAGHAGKAFWFDKENGGFVTSKHYYSSYPLWVESWNKNYESKNEIWYLSHQENDYRYAKAPRLANPYPDFGSQFPHQLGSTESENYYKFLSMTPFADELTANFAIELLKNEHLGLSNTGTDYLAVSFSAVDAIGHQFGPNSLESEDNLLRLDKTLAKLLAAIDKEVGLQNTLIVLTADHGVSDSPAYLHAHQIKETPLIDEVSLQKTIEQNLADRFKLPPESLQAISLPFVYLNHQVLDEHKLTIREVSNYLIERLRNQPGIFQVYAMPMINSEKDWLSAKVDKMTFPQRSGDLYLVPPPYQSLANREYRTSHGSPWQYDSYVPLLFVNPAFKAQRFTRSVNTTDIAPTLAALLAIKTPSGAVGEPLAEVIAASELSFSRR